MSMNKSLSPCRPYCTEYRNALERSTDPATWTKAELLAEYRTLAREHDRLQTREASKHKQLESARAKLEAIPTWIQSLFPVRKAHVLIDDDEDE